MRNLVSKIKKCVYPIYFEGHVIGSFFRIQTGQFVTCYHVVKNEAGLKVKIGDHYTDLKVIDSEKSLDIAICEIPSNEINSSFDSINVGKYSDVDEGDEVFVCGFPLRSDYPVTHRGMVSAKQIISGRQGLQIDASINRGNSGGPCVIDIEGTPTVVGIIATRLVDVDFSKLNKTIKIFNTYPDRYDDPYRRQMGGAIADLLLALAGSTGDALNQYLNVGFGEAVSIDYVLKMIESAPSVSLGK